MFGGVSFRTVSRSTLEHSEDEEITRKLWTERKVSQHKQVAYYTDICLEERKKTTKNLTVRMARVEVEI